MAATGGINFRRLAVLAVLGVSAGCVLSPPPAHTSYLPFVLLLVLADAAYLGGLLLPERRPGARAACFVLFGLLASGLDLIQPWGPGFVGAFVAVSSLAVLLPPRPAMAAGLPVLLAAGCAEAVTSAYPWSALLNIALGFLFFFGAASIAGLSREAQQRAEQLLAQEASTRQAREEAAALAERSRLARELHDVLAHTLSGLSLQLEAARLLARRDGCSEPVLEQITLAQRQARDGVAAGKRAIAALRGQDIAGTADIPALVAAFERDAGIRTVLAGGPDARNPQVPAEVGLAAFRTVQESLSNIRKHAPDSVAVEVEVSRSGGGLSVRVANTLPEGSVAKTPAAGGQQSFGLAGLAERAAALGGTFSSGPDQAGYANHAFFPLPAAGQRTAPKEPHD